MTQTTGVAALRRHFETLLLNGAINEAVRAALDGALTEAAAEVWSAAYHYGVEDMTGTETLDVVRRNPYRVDHPKWVDLFGIDPDYCDGKPVDEWLKENRGEA